MVPLDRVKACGHQTCRALLPADPDDEAYAGFHAKVREGGVGSRVRSWQSWCKDCVRESTRVRSGIKQRGRPYEARRELSPQERGARTRKRRRHFRELREAHERRMRTDPAYARAYRARQVERKRVARRRAGVPPRFPGRRSEGLPAEPLAAFLRERLPAIEGGGSALGRRVGMDEARIRTLARGTYWCSRQQRFYPIRRVSLRVAERVVEAAGGLLDEVWPDGLV